MKKLYPLLLFSAFLGACEADSKFKNYITARNDKLYDGSQELYFISFNIPNLFYVEDELAFECVNPWRFPNEFEIRDALTSIKQMGGQVCRTYTLSVRHQDDPPHIPKFVTAPGEFNEDAFLTLDRVLQCANDIGIRLIIPFVDNWKWWGGVAEYAAFHGKSKDAFWTDPYIKDDFKKTIQYVLERKNVYTGVRYKDDKCILAWETGNELQSPAEWTVEMAAFIKSIDKNHLVMDGFHTSVLRDASLAMKDVDIVTTHHYPQNARQLLDQLQKNLKKLDGTKPYIVGEFGFIDTPGTAAFLDRVIENKISGALIWSLRYHRREGGFYWHSEPFGGDLYKAYHWPGFPSGDRYDETELLALMRSMAFKIQNKPPPVITAPAAPVLLPIRDVAAISWQGACGASGYDIERAGSKDGPWKIIGTNISDAAVQYRPLFQDKTAKPGTRYYYRVKARNSGGISPPSNIQQGLATNRTLIDEMANSKLWAGSTGKIEFVSKNARPAREDIHRIRMRKGHIVYQAVAPESCQIFSFFENEINDILVFTSVDGQRWQQSNVKKRSFHSGEGDYGYYKPVLFSASELDPSARYVKIVVTGKTEFSRIRIDYAG